MNMNIVWAVLAVLFLVIEACTVGLASLWFAVGAVCALIASLLGAPVWLQIVWFLLISAATLIVTRPLVKKYVNNKSQPTNADRLLGSTCRVTETIDNLAGTGAVRADGKVWSARTLDGQIIEEGAVVTVKEIRGVKLMVSAGESK